MLRLAMMVCALAALVGCTNYAGEAAQLRDACNAGGSKTACIDYQTLIATCIAPHGLIADYDCQGVGPASPLHSDGAAAAIAAQPVAVTSGPSSGNVNCRTPDGQPIGYLTSADACFKLGGAYSSPPEHSP